MLLLVLLFVSACATTRVHLFTQGIAPEQLSRVSTSLRHHGFRVHLVDLQPPDLAGATLIYSPAHPRIADIDTIRATLSELGYTSLDPVAVGTENHSYSRRNVGVYLGQAETRRQPQSTEPQLPAEFSGNCDSDDAYLNLNPLGTFIIEIIGWDKKEISTFLTGEWKKREETLELFLGKSTLQFRIENIERKDKHTRHQYMKLSQLNKPDTFGNCWFSYSATTDL